MTSAAAHVRDPGRALQRLGGHPAARSPELTGRHPSALDGERHVTAGPGARGDLVTAGGAAAAPVPATAICTPWSARAWSSVAARSSWAGGSSVTRRVMTSVGTVWNMVSEPSLVWSARTTTSAAAWTSARSTLAESMLDVESPRSAVRPLPERKARETRRPWSDCSAPLPTRA